MYFLHIFCHADKLLMIKCINKTFYNFSHRNLIPAEEPLTPISIESRADKTILDQLNTGYINVRKMANLFLELVLALIKWDQFPVGF